jgi:hypothetical protein
VLPGTVARWVCASCAAAAAAAAELMPPTRRLASVPDPS